MDHLHACFSNKPLKYFLGMEVARGPIDLFLASTSMLLKLSTSAVFWVLSLVIFPWRKIINLLWLLYLLRLMLEDIDFFLGA